MDDTHPNENQAEQPNTILFQFNGSGFEYFQIWIVNILLTIITLGIYSAWAKVRSNRYFYSNLYLDNNNFRYLAKPLTLLKGRIIAVLFFIIYVYTIQTLPLVGSVLSILLFFAIPFFINQALAFNHRMSAYKNIQFRFKSTYQQAFFAIYIWPLLGILSLGILYPYALLKLNQYLTNNSAYGASHFTFSATYKDYAIILLIVLGVGTVTGGMIWAITYFINPVFFLSPIMLVIIYFGLFVYFTVSTTNLFYRSLSLTEHHFNANLTIAGLAKVMLINGALILITLGLYAPAAKVRMTKYMASCITMEAAAPLDDFVAAEKENISVIGEELGEVFDFGL